MPSTAASDDGKEFHECSRATGDDRLRCHVGVTPGRRTDCPGRHRCTASAQAATQPSRVMSNRLRSHRRRPGPLAGATMRPGRGTASRPSVRMTPRPRTHRPRTLPQRTPHRLRGTLRRRACRRRERARLPLAPPQGILEQLLARVSRDQPGSRGFRLEACRPGSAERQWKTIGPPGWRCRSSRVLHCSSGRLSRGPGGRTADVHPVAHPAGRATGRSSCGDVGPRTRDARGVRDRGQPCTARR
jgi:hypothetical protein